jgi:hypothetical protein
MILSKHIAHYRTIFCLYFNLKTPIECANPIYHLIDLLIDLCLTPTSAILQLYCDVNKF